MHDGTKGENFEFAVPIVALNTENPFVDGRQSDRAMVIRAGLERHLGEAGWVTLPELVLANGRRADLIGLSASGLVLIVEIKSSVEDFRVDTKWPDYLDYCDRFAFATLPDVPADIFPKQEGLYIADEWGAEPMRGPVERRLAAARRKAVTLRFARATAQRLTRCCAHAGLSSSTFGDNGEGA